ncbi:MAG: hypothetical protein QNJ63_13810 [Calothrix sp. MO_192.B10]|nr:hypothetical protein [Calothrix sp. MO_192.B10]
MARTQKISKNASRVYRSLVATAFITSGVFQFVAPALADGTAAGTEIKNTATATYQDPNNPNETLNATSNEVVITIAEVAGVTVTANGTEFQADNGSDGTGAADGTINNGDVIYYNYTVKNVGNDPTKIRIPNQPQIQGNGVLEPVPDTAATPVNAAVQISYDGGTNWVAVDNGNFTTNSIPANGSVLVRVAVKVTGAANEDVISLQLGNTPSGNDQNISRNDTPNDVYTVDNPDGDPGETAGVPVNGTREASATQEVTVDSNLINYSLATVLKTRGNQTSTGAAGPQDDTIDYELSLRVEGNDVTGNGLTPSALEGTTINVDGTDGKYILISDAIPKDTELAAAPTNVPNGWEAVYTEDAVTTDAHKAAWKKFSTTAPASLGAVKRVGFIKTGSVNTNTTVSGFNIQLKVTSAAATVDVANIAQLFGSSPNNNPVYDESGDQTPSNYNGTNFPGDGADDDILPDVPTAPDTFIPDADVDDGYIDDPSSIPNGDVDTGNNNEGTANDGNGEINLIQITTPAAVSVLNGPKDKPAAESEGDNNKDFTNQSALIPAGTAPGSTINPDGVGFNNTVRNTGGTDANISLIPTPPETATDLPDDTLVTISSGSLSAVYKYQDDGAGGKEFAFQSGVGTVDGNPISATNPVRIDNVASNPGGDTTKDAPYAVEVDLPDGTKLSTDDDMLRGFPVPITAYVEDGTTAGFQSGEDPNNITIDQVYTGYLKLVKESAIVPDDGSQPTFDSNPKTPAPGDKIAYKITAKNISEPQNGTDNIILDAQNVTITEDGTNKNYGGSNNWALDNDNNTFMDTTHVNGAIGADGGEVEFYTGELEPPNKPQTNTEQPEITMYVVKYLNVVIGPGQEKVFTFQREVENNVTP